MSRRRPLRMLAALTAAFLLGGCAAGGDITRPIPTAYIPAPQPAHRLVVMLPGRGDDLAGLQRHRIAALIQQQWPDADVILTGLTMPFYLQGRAPQRLHDEVIAPALAQHPHRQLWLMGISLGGMGALLYDRAYPKQAHGLLLLSPYLGDRAIRHEIQHAGGLAHWQPGPPQPLTSATFQRELWRYLQDWIDRPQRARTTWIAYGASERFRTSIALLTPVLPGDHVLERPGHHNWTLWTPAARQLLERAGR
ncbi:alpha/beta hydrolase [Oleiagrimonas soli]|uniref:Pimeloyl-ACP methyl ester carboxylesterase n=1 Tax=Oleiagrimonas soli TaxID=1543381 RepID=A0A099CWR0_9GAMM|nr:alpha/beta hydrolase [Oleiagrimonas soli]KGI78096.1 hypothetical protein LF63_0106970 [Oleiagrimonas soli]MBB6183477.1 pimeloyl-ACP methyl ester carboxylesterase [Oleiagrimonas soli]